MKKKLKNYSLRCSEELYNEIENLAKKIGVPKHSIILMAIYESLAD